MKDGNSETVDEEAFSYLTMSYNVSESINTKSKCSQKYNQTYKSKQTQDNVDFALSPSEASLPNGRVYSVEH